MTEAPDSVAIMATFVQRIKEAEQSRDAAEAKDLLFWLNCGGLESLKVNLAARLRVLVGGLDTAKPVAPLKPAAPEPAGRTRGETLVELWSYNDRLTAILKRFREPLRVDLNSTVNQLEATISIQVARQIGFRPNLEVAFGFPRERKQLGPMSLLELGVTALNNKIKVTPARYQLLLRKQNLKESLQLWADELTTIEEFTDAMTELFGFGWSQLTIGDEIYHKGKPKDLNIPLGATAYFNDGTKERPVVGIIT
ncbi:Hypothetical protein POVN_LOCUS602 [uncultured virus]|nr:Hypothetical protein POVN_LOCUS602 [uncultured virus]